MLILVAPVLILSGTGTEFGGTGADSGAEFKWLTKIVHLGHTEESFRPLLKT